MALLNCPECHKEISDKSKSCPNCGFPMEEIKFHESLNAMEFEEDRNEFSTPIKEEIKQPTPTLPVVSSKEETSFWSFPAAKGMLVLVIMSLCLSGYSIYSSSIGSDSAQRIQTLEENYTTTQTKIDALELGIQITEGLVTDKVIVQKAIFYPLADKKIIGSIDLRPQPVYQNKFLGQGSFNLTDREIRGMIEEVVTKLITYFEPGSYELAGISVTANNYPVATYSEGTVTLAGE